eukprot:GFUD01042050.1.p1 GENE.GFUD01042050.1~~GFUD01042050.1.p1  ORF type:complete len:394 (+),score=135.83 GFUD01042050.1:81-1262(+)
MPGTSLDVGSLSLLVLVVIISCCLATLLSWCLVRSTSPRTFLYCSTCAQQLGVLPAQQAVLTDGVVARPWVEFVQPGVGRCGDSATFQRLGMRTARPGMGLEVEQLETRPLSPVDCEDEDGEGVKDTAVERNEKQQIFSPSSADVLARRDSVRSVALGSHMSRRTLVFPNMSQKSIDQSKQEAANLPHGPTEKILEKSSSINSPSNTLIGAETDQPEQSGEDVRLERGDQNMQQRKVRRSASARKEKSKYMLLRRQEEAGFTSQSEDERGEAGSRHSRRQYTGVVDGEAVGAAKEMDQHKVAQIDAEVGGHSNYAFVNSEEIIDPPHLNPKKLGASRNSVISPLPQQPQSPSIVLSPRQGYENLPTTQFPPRTSTAAIPVLSPPEAAGEMIQA